jgi:hypothetical protein
MFIVDGLCEFDAVVLVDQPGVCLCRSTLLLCPTNLPLVTRVRPALPLAGVLRRDAPPGLSLHRPAALRALPTSGQLPPGPREPRDAALWRAAPLIPRRCGA